MFLINSIIFKKEKVRNIFFSTNISSLFQSHFSKCLLVNGGSKTNKNYILWIILRHFLITWKNRQRCISMNRHMHTNANIHKCTHAHPCKIQIILLSWVRGFLISFLSAVPYQPRRSVLSGTPEVKLTRSWLYWLTSRNNS